MAAFYKLPAEILLEIAENAEALDLISFSATCRWVYSVVNLVACKKVGEEFPYILPWACETEQVELVQKMLIAGVNPNIPHRLRENKSESFRLRYRLMTGRHFDGNWDDEEEGMDEDEGSYKLLKMVYEPDDWMYLRTLDLDSTNSPFYTDFTGVDLTGICEVYDGPEENRRDYEREQYRGKLGPLFAYDSHNPKDYSQAIMGESWDWGSYWFPLHAAAKAGSNEIIQLLVTHGSHLDLPSLRLHPFWDTKGPFWETKGLWTPLHTALHFGNGATANLLISLGVSLRVDLEHRKSTALHSAVYGGCISTLQYLVDNDYPLDANATDGAGRLPLDRARGIKTILWLIAHGADLNAGPEIYRTVQYHFYRACFNRRFRDAIRYVESRANIPADWKNDEYALSAVCLLEPDQDDEDTDDEEDRTELLRKMLKTGAALDTPETTLSNPLVNASKSHLLPLMKILLAAGANICKVDKGGHFPLLGAVDTNDAPRSGPKRDALRYDTVAWLLDNGADPNQRSIHKCCDDGLKEYHEYHQKDGHHSPTRCEDTPLTFLCKQSNLGNQTQLVKLLLDKGANADLHVEFETRVTALKIAIHHGNYDVARYLLENGATSLDPQDVLDMVDYSVKYNYGNYTETTEKTIRKRFAFIHEVDKNKTLTQDPKALWIATKACIAPLADILMDMGASDPNWVSEDGNTCIHNLVESRCIGFVGVAERLIGLGFDVKSGSCLSYAMSEGEWNVVEILLHHGAPFELDPIRKLHTSYHCADHCTDYQSPDLPFLKGMRRASFNRTEYKYDKMIARLLDVKISNSDHPTAYAGYLQAACKEKLLHTIATLVKAGVDVDSLSCSGLTPFALFDIGSDFRIASWRRIRIKPKSIIDTLKMLLNGREYPDDEEIMAIHELKNRSDVEAYSKRSPWLSAVRDEFSRRFLAGVDPETSRFRIQLRDVNEKWDQLRDMNEK